jgi:hypothetical protein
MTEFDKAIERSLAENGHDLSATIKFVLKKVQSSSEWRDKVITIGADRLVREYLSKARQPGSYTSDRVFDGTRPLSPERVAQIKRVVMPAQAAQEARRRFMDTATLYGGHIPLAKATWRDAAESARKYGTVKVANERMEKFHRWFGETLKRAGDKKTGEEVFKDDILKDKARKFKADGDML